MKPIIPKRAMGRPPSIDGGKPVRLQAAFTRSEAQQVDAARGDISRSAWMRLAIIAALKK